MTGSRCSEVAGIESPHSVVDLVYHWAHVSPQRRFVADDRGVVLTYAHTASAVAALAADLHGRGAGEGERVAIVVENSAAWVVGFLAAIAAGAIVVPLPTRTSSEELERLLDHAEPVVVLVGGAPAVELATRWADRSMQIPISLDGAVELASRAHGDAAACLTYTSGTTGRPKGVLLSNHSLILASETYAALFHSTPLTHTVVAVPLCHNTGFIDQLGHVLIAGGSLEVHRRFRADVIARSIVAGECTFFIGVPTMYHRIVEELAGRPATAVAPWLAFGGAPMPTPLIGRIREVFPNAGLANCYGLSEATSITHVQFVGGEAADGAVGVAVAGTLDRVSPDGELLVRSRTGMIGYFRDPMATSAKLLDGWLRTGDLATRGDDGVVRVLGRIDELINRGGEKIAPLEVEEALLRHPLVAEAAVVGVPDVEFGQIVVAAVVERSPLAAGELDRHLRALLAHHKCPARIVVVDALPRNANGKVHMAGVRKLFA